MNYQAAMFYLTLFMTIVNSAIALYVWWTNRDKITNTRFKALEDKMIKIESDIQHPPACPHHPDFKLRLEAIDRGLSKIDGRLEGIGRMVDLLTQNELSGGKQ